MLMYRNIDLDGSSYYGRSKKVDKKGKEKLFFIVMKIQMDEIIIFIWFWIRDNMSHFIKPIRAVSFT